MVVKEPLRTEPEASATRKELPGMAAVIPPGRMTWDQSMRRRSIRFLNKVAGKTIRRTTRKTQEDYIPFLLVFAGNGIHRADIKTK